MMSIRLFERALAVAGLMLGALVTGPAATAESASCSGATVLVVAGASPAPHGDRSLVGALEAQHGAACVTTIADDDVTVATAQASDVVVVTSSVLPSLLGSRLRDAAVPILVSEPFLFDDMSMVAPGGGKELQNRTTVTITDEAHPLAASLSGTVSVFTASSKLNYGLTSAAAGAQGVANTGGASLRTTVFGFATGAQMVGRTAVAPRVGFFSSYGAELTANGRVLLDAAIDWLIDQGSELTCGATVTADVVLEADLIGCPGKGLVIGADGVTIDLNGHTIGGSATSMAAGDEGVSANRFDGVTVRNGTIRDFFYGVELISSSDNRIEDITFSDNAASVEFVAVHDSVVRANTSTSATFWGVARLSNSNRNVLSNNSSDNSRYGIVVANGEANQVTGNNLDGGTRGYDRGVLVESASTDTLISTNTIRGFAWGVRLEGASTDTTIVDNTAHENTVDGIRIDADATTATLTRNAADDNAEWGIRALGPAVDGGGNTADGNGTGACLGLACNVEPPPRGLLVAGSTSPPSGDVEIVAMIEAAGVDLSIVDDDSNLGAINPEDYDIIFISTSVVPGKVGATFKDAPVPVIVWEGYLFDDMALSSSGETTRTRTDITVVDPIHPLAGGLDAGNHRVYTTAQKLSYGRPAPDAEIVAHEPGRAANAVIFNYDAGDLRIDATPAPGLRVALFPNYPGALHLNETGHSLIATAIEWVLAGGPPANDDFVDRFTVTGVTASGDNVGATLEPGEPNLSLERSVWWEWTAAIDGLVDIDIDTEFDAITVAYAGNTLPSLEQLAVDYAYDHRLTFAIRAGETYQIAVGSRFDPTVQGDYEMRITEVVRPPNDDFADAFVVSDGVHAGTNVGGTLEPGEPQPPGFEDDIGEASVWWSWTPAVEGVAHIDTVGSDFDTVLGVWLGDAVTTLDRVVSDDDGGPDATSVVGFRVAAGTTYRVAVYGYGTSRGTITLAIDLTEAVAPPNDDFAAALPFTGDHGTGVNTGATLEPGEATLGQPGSWWGDLIDGSMWWTWTAPSDGMFVFDTAGSNAPNNPPIGIWQGSDLGSLTLLAASSYWSGEPYDVAIAATAGEQYHLAVYRAPGFEGDVRLNVRGDLPDNPVVVAEADGDVGFALDAAGLPVFAYNDGSGVVVMRCNDPVCDGGDETVNLVDPEASSGTVFVTLALDDGLPVIVFDSGYDTKLMRCNDLECAGDDEAVAELDPSDGDWVDGVELRLDPDGNPVIISTEFSPSPFFDYEENWLLHCNDPMCAGGDDVGVLIADASPSPSDLTSSFAVDSIGHPVLARKPAITLVRCDDPSCDGAISGSEPSQLIPVAGPAQSVRLDPSGNPMLGYSTGGGPGAVYCNDPLCADDDVIVTIPTSYEAGSVIADVDGRGNPVIGWVDAEAGALLRVARCVDQACTSAPVVTDLHYDNVGIGLIGLDIDPVTDHVTVAYRAGDPWADGNPFQIKVDRLAGS